MIHIFLPERSTLFVLILVASVYGQFENYCSSGMPDGSYCVYGSRLIVCRDGHNVVNKVCDHGCRDGLCIPAPFCTDEILYNSSRVVFCRDALSFRSRTLYFDQRNNLTNSDEMAASLYSSLISGNVTSGCSNQIYMYACAVYFPDCEARGDTCREFAGNCPQDQEVNLPASKCIWKESNATLYAVVGAMCIMVIAIILAVVYMILHRRAQSQLSSYQTIQ
jgi:hypothetical protein